MRLIDADELIANLKPEESVWIGLVLAEQVVNAPTVEAIPIEWIKKWLNNIANNERYKNDYVELTEEVKRIVYRQEMMIIKIPCISDMLEDWKKENERNV